MINPGYRSKSLIFQDQLNPADETISHTKLVCCEWLDVPQSILLFCLKKSNKFCHKWFKQELGGKDRTNFPRTPLPHPLPLSRFPCPGPKLCFPPNTGKTGRFDQSKTYVWKVSRYIHMNSFYYLSNSSDRDTTLRNWCGLPNASTSCLVPVFLWLNSWGLHWSLDLPSSVS